MADKNWIQDAVKRPGLFSAKAKKAGLSTQDYAHRVLASGSKAPLRLRREAQFALNMARLGARRKQ